ncbi:MAG: DUF1566 domain-containing protein [Thermoflexales bacterium]|nr:DUF1566 domain-containing protein [Thermoflexales bacterium]
MTPKLLTPVPKMALIALVLMIAASPFIASRAVGLSAAAPIDERSFDESTSVSTPTAPLTQTMGITQTLSDEAQRNTIAFDGLAFLTGSLGADSFFPPGKVADFWGFQYLRDNDLSQMGHNPLFLTSAAFNMWNVLTTAQRTQLKTLANAQVSSINNYATMRFVLMKAFRRLLDGDVPTGSAGLDKDAVMAYSADLYKLDGQMSYDRAQVMGGIIASLSPSQTAFLNTNMVGKGMLQWPAVTEPSDMQGLQREVKEALMTYAGDIYSWYAGSIEADVYFCPERQGTYFGSFYLKDTPVMSVGGSIDPNLTANAGITFVLTLSPTQASLVTGLVDIQHQDLQEIVDRREEMSAQFRRFIAGQPVSLTEVLSQANRYGELDGEIVYHIATNFAAVSRTLSTSQLATLNGLRQQILGEFPLIPEPYAYRYSDRIDMPTITNTNFLFLPALTEKVYLPLVGLGIGDVITTTSPTLPDTGQVSDYTAIFGEDADYSINPPAYTVNGNGTVTDQVTGFMWQQSDGGEMTYANALTYCQSLTLGGYTDWSLPPADQLFNILNHDRNPALNTTAFTSTAAEYWWSNQTQANDASKVWVVNAGGGIGPHPMSETISAGGLKRYHTRCVRNTSTTTSDFTTNGSLTVSDATTGLMWQQAEVTPTVTWEGALIYCENLSLGDQSDWRFPNIKELHSLNDVTHVNPSIDTTAFPSAQAARYWSSTTLLGGTGKAWFTDFSDGRTSYEDKTSALLVRCVRSD